VHTASRALERRVDLDPLPRLVGYLAVALPDLGHAGDGVLKLPTKLKGGSDPRPRAYEWDASILDVGQLDGFAERPDAQGSRLFHREDRKDQGALPRATGSSDQC